MAGKVAIVTGGSRGIGRAICTGLAHHGVKVVVASRTENDIEFDTETGNSAGAKFAKYASGSISDTVSGIKDAGGTAIAVRCDVSDSQDLENLVAAAWKPLGALIFWSAMRASTASPRWRSWTWTCWTGAWQSMCGLRYFCAGLPSLP